MANSLLSEEELTRFRTKPCRRSRKEGCDFGPYRCQYSHNIFWPRRCPFYLSDPMALRYLPDLCPDVIIKNEETGAIESTCNRGGYCPFAHSMEEIIYHPLCYKTELCDDFQKGECKTYYCHLIHGLAEKRPEKNYTLPYTRGIKVRIYPNVSLVDKPASSDNGRIVQIANDSNQVKSPLSEDQTVTKKSKWSLTGIQEIAITNSGVNEGIQSNKSMSTASSPGLFCFNSWFGNPKGTEQSSSINMNWSDFSTGLYSQDLNDPCEELKSLNFKWQSMLESPESYINYVDLTNPKYWEEIFTQLSTIFDVVNRIKVTYCQDSLCELPSVSRDPETSGSSINSDELFCIKDFPNNTSSNLSSLFEQIDMISLKSDIAARNGNSRYSSSILNDEDEVSRVQPQINF
ncbi:zinc finger, CCCH type domain-containing protein [Cryptosporidium muris RN66]|uniref:Zinc finger, CCCH type domain-containing protein n=1 Tax=Cryptosporidium muris (strain RN66) TaxID=441375 RepID=B6A9U0_CRYMR|nr:zinc finger, CCCH type domain-containing protein [Cryptosporidium muris RN66]EEA04981.1 zinc finger, CCCH type domain-containing protein [Cryptosporidium muris RN66]|eukprot:XP_002139330.1 zinc finger, CCCH type domain-containing protein [Cryptosporidium muris RN66]